MRRAAVVHAWEKEFDALCDGLNVLVDSDARDEIVWSMRQLVMERCE